MEWMLQESNKKKDNACLEKFQLELQMEMLKQLAVQNIIPIR